MAQFALTKALLTISMESTPLVDKVSRYDLLPDYGSGSTDEYNYSKSFCLSLRYFFFISSGALTSSSILASLDSKYWDKLNSYLDPVLKSPGRSRFVRCWHAKTDGWAASTFHSNCDGKGPTVTIVQVGSYIFGGYTDKSWGGEYLIS